MSTHVSRNGNPRTVDQLIAAEARGQKFDYLPFWSHRQLPGRGLGAGYLSQWWPQSFTHNGHVYATAEHYMMAHKAWLFGDNATAERILAAPHPRDAKALGRLVRGFRAQTWERERFAIVVSGNRAKFTADRALRDYLLSTSEAVLVEASPTDRVWGIGLPVSDPRAAASRTWRGLNLLGFALTTVRDQLAD